MPADPDYSQAFAPYRRMMIWAWIAPGSYAVGGVIWTLKLLIADLRGPGFLANYCLILSLVVTSSGLRACFFFFKWKCPQCGEQFGGPGYGGPLRCQHCELEVPRWDNR